MEDTVRDSMESAYGYGDIYTEYYFDQLEDSISEIEDVDLTFFIYEKKLACVRVEIEDEEAEIRFLGGDTRMQNMQFLIDGEEMLRIEGEKKDTTEVRTVFLEGEESVTLEYNRKTGLLDITADGGRTVIAGNIFLDKDSFNASIDRVMVDGQFVDLTFGMNIKKRVCIMSEKKEEITRFILDTLHSGASLYQAVGAYTGETREEIIVIVTKQEYIKLISFISQTDPAAFITVYNVNEVIYRPKKIV